MSVASRTKSVAAVLVVCMAAILTLAGTDGVYSQESSGAKPAAEKKTPKFRGRVPMYYGPVVTSKQREQIYAIQQKYSEQIEQLEKQLEELKSRRDSEVEAVLTPEQQAQVKQAREAAAAKRKAKAD